MTELTYRASPVPIRDDLAAAHRRAWRRIAGPGTWWDGPTRVAIAAETRNAPACTLCRRRKEALSPNAVAGTHDSLGALPEIVVEVIHRVRTDASRLTESWYREALDNGLSDGEYVETVGIVATMIAIDSFTHAMGLPTHPLPEPLPGEPSRHRPAGAKPGLAWVPTIAPEDLTDAEPEIYLNRSAANIHRALSLVPDEVAGFFDLDDVQYLPDALLRDFGNEHRDITHAQIELLAARVSAINQCVY